MSDFKSKAKSLVLDHVKFRDLSASLVAAMADSISQSRNHTQSPIDPNTQLGKRLTRPFSLSMGPNISILEKSENIFQIKQVHAPVTTSGMLHAFLAANKLLYAYTHHQDLSHACLLFDRMEERNLISWNIMIGGFAKVGDFMQCLGTFRELIRRGAQPDSYTLPFVIKACRYSMGINMGRLIHCCAVKYGLHLNQFVCATLADMYAKCGVIEGAKQLFDKMPSKDLVTWTVMIGAYAEWGNVNESLALFDRLREEGFVPDKITMVAVVNACAKLGAMSKARLIYDYIRANNFSLDVILGTALIDMYAKCGSADSAREIFDKMQNKNVITWSAMVAAYGYVGEGKTALELFSVMLSGGILPNKITFLSLLYACSTAGLVEEGLHLFSTMSENYGLSPDIEHYTCIVDLFGRAGRLDEASRFIENMMVEKDEGFWATLLRAFRNHRSNDMAEKAAQSLLELQTLIRRHYMLLSNIYAGAGRGKEIAEIGDLMTERKLMKIPSYTWIEVDNIVYTFSTGHTAHPRATEIYEMLKTLSEKLKLAGYIPDTNFVFLDVDEEVKAWDAART